jgi:hypothetical protein
MEKTRQESAENVLENNAQDTDRDLRTLKDLELLLVGGGGDDTPSW